MFWTILASVAAAQAPAGEAAEGLVLWQGAREGMNAEEVAAQVRLVDGIKSVKVRPSRKRWPLSIQYDGDGIDLDGLFYEVDPTFADGKLETVALKSEACLILATAKFKKLRGILEEKYGAALTQREVVESGETVGARSTFSADGLRVMLRLEPGSVPSYVYMSGKIGRAIAKSMNSAVDSDRAECPAELGQRGTVQITYLNEASAAAVEAAASDEAAQKRSADKDKL